MNEELALLPFENRDPDANTIFRCKHCKVQVNGRLDFTSVLGHEHKRGCPRRRLGK